MRQDLEHLKLLAIFYYIMAGLTFLIACFFLIYFFMGLAMVNGAFPTPPPPPGAAPGTPNPAVAVQRMMGWMFLVFGGAAVLFGWAIAIAAAIAGRCLQVHRRWTFCFVVACILCLQVPMGTALGVFTILVLVRPTVKDLFAGQLHPHDPEDEDASPELAERDDEAPPPRLRERLDDDRYSDSPRGPR